MKRFLILLLAALPGYFTFARSGDGSPVPLKTGNWKGVLQRADGGQIVFIFDVRYEKGKPLLRIHNAGERLEVKQVSQSADSVFIEMPFFESSFRLQQQPDGSLAGNWIKGTSSKTIVMPFTATPGNIPRFTAAAAPQANLTGKWELTFSKNGDTTPAVAQLQQKGALLTGSILTPTGDYRYLEGIVAGDSLYLSTFDGSHAYVFTAAVGEGQTLRGGRFISGPVYQEDFTGRKNEQAMLPMEEVAMRLKGDEDRLNFRFPDINGKPVGINDKRFAGKVVIVQIMGSWCPNCMDETAFLSEYYRRNRGRGVEMVALAYEYSTDTARSNKTLRKFRDRFNVTYPILLTGVTTGDTLRTQKTLPQLTEIKSFPSTVFIGRDGRVKKVHGGFFGPATGEAYTQYKAEFEETVNSLLVE
ncbi:peroxiredoxin family protein [Flavihumibacter petaseus]|uniref:Putative thioderoxin n=1 Tax=Flavihumibacter petaseus NBRC 106054 TaxID=1220578 RepID=A0A0E9N1U2_9BACT|nr:TlpA disulfide reductase family protein [Flavihumibacter petaseus]GAO43310.1 putative thioderoxin [Flavihumibacter petaseus NBRC 106054]